VSENRKIIDVLIVQQSRSYASKLKDYIDKMSGYKVIDYAFDGITAIEYAVELKPDLIIVDLILPQIDGFGVIEQIKSTDGFKDTKIILTSSIAMEFVMERLGELPIDYFFIKPITFKTFSDRVNEIFDSKTLHDVYSVQHSNKKVEFIIKDYLRAYFAPI
jgi:two-component system, response regulator, stage 0 sporulation protein A